MATSSLPPPGTVLAFVPTKDSSKCKCLHKTFIINIKIQRLSAYTVDSYDSALIFLSKLCDLNLIPSSPQCQEYL